MLEHFSVYSDRKVENLIADQDANSIIDLSNQNLLDSSMASIVKYGIKEKECRILNLWGNRFTSRGLLVLVNTLYENKTLRELDLSHNRLGDDGIEILAKFLSLNNCSIRYLDLSSNGITDVGAQYLANMLTKNTSLESLTLNKNEIEDGGLIYIAEALKTQNQKLVELRLDENLFITRTGVEKVLEVLKDQTVLGSLHVQNCTIIGTAFTLAGVGIGSSHWQTTTDTTSNEQIYIPIVLRSSDNNNIRCYMINATGDANTWNFHLNFAAGLSTIGIIFIFSGGLMTLLMVFGDHEPWIFLIAPSFLFLACLFMLADLAEGSRVLNFNDYSAYLYETGHVITIFSCLISAWLGGRLFDRPIKTKSAKRLQRLKTSKQ
ncbi:hypothetical protein I4U23_001319 [Adineta vaga]|nr:hypothetical protein I4U23_001319 [Adineta vaga]